MEQPVKFADGSTYCDCGREVERRMFWYLHKDDLSMACFQQPTPSEISYEVMKDRF